MRGDDNTTEMAAQNGQRVEHCHEEWRALKASKELVGQ